MTEGAPDVHCFACNESIELATGDRVGFRDACPVCNADVRTCRNCAHHDLSAHNECREPNAEWVPERERANRCDYFRPGAGGGGEIASAVAQAKAELDALFRK